MRKTIIMAALGAALAASAAQADTGQPRMIHDGSPDPIIGDVVTFMRQVMPWIVGAGERDFMPVSHAAKLAARHAGTHITDSGIIPISGGSFILPEISSSGNLLISIVNTSKEACSGLIYDATKSGLSVGLETLSVIGPHGLSIVERDGEGRFNAKGDELSCDDRPMVRLEYVGVSE